MTRSTLHTKLLGARVKLIDMPNKLLAEKTGTILNVYLKDGEVWYSLNIENPEPGRTPIQEITNIMIDKVIELGGAA